MKKFKRFMLKLVLFIIFQTVVLYFADNIKNMVKTEFYNTFGEIFMFEDKPDSNSVQPMETVSPKQQIPESFEIKVPILGTISGNMK